MMLRGPARSQAFQLAVIWLDEHIKELFEYYVLVRLGASRLFFLLVRPLPVKPQTGQRNMEQTNPLVLVFASALVSSTDFAAHLL